MVVTEAFAAKLHLGCCRCARGRPNLDDGFMLDDGAGQFEIGIGNGAVVVRPTEKIRWDVRWKTGPPQNGSFFARSSTGVAEFLGCSLLPIDQGRRGNEI